LSIRRYNQDGKDSSIAIGKSGYSNGLADSIGSKSTRLRYQTGNAILTERNKEYALISAFFTVIAFLIVFSLILAGLTYIAFRDYTRSLEATVKSLEEANETLLKYNFNSYHSLKTPLRNINGFLQLLEKKYKAQFDEEAKEYMNFIIEGVKQLSIIIDDMRHKFLESGDGDKGNG
jgi:signal transduction histidine kinase